MLHGRTIESRPRCTAIGPGQSTPENVKIRGTFVKARTYLDYLNPEYLRYYFAAKLGPDVSDIDLSWTTSSSE